MKKIDVKVGDYIFQFVGDSEPKKIRYGDKFFVAKYLIADIIDSTDNAKKTIQIKRIGANTIPKSANYYFLLDLKDDRRLITKTLSVSANGNVFPGCLMSYDRVDTSPMFNMMDCNNDFFERVNDFCWQYPVNHQVANLRSKYEAYKFCEKNNINLRIDQNDEINLNVLDYISRKSERIAKEIHSQYPELDFLIVEPLSDLMVAKMLLSTNFPIDQIKGYLGLLSELEMDIVNAISIDLCNQWIKKIKEHYHIK